MLLFILWLMLGKLTWRFSAREIWICCWYSSSTIPFSRAASCSWCFCASLLTHALRWWRRGGSWGHTGQFASLGAQRSLKSVAAYIIQHPAFSPSSISVSPIWLPWFACTSPIVRSPGVVRATNEWSKSPFASLYRSSSVTPCFSTSHTFKFAFPSRSVVGKKYPASL